MWNRKALVLSAILLLFLSCSFLYVEVQPVRGTGAGWLTGWLYRKSHVINAAAGSGAGYQVQIKVYKGSGVDGTETVDGIYSGKIYTSGHCQDDFGDVRFSDDDGSTGLCYWLEDNSLSSGSSTVFWVKVADDLTNNPQTIYIYYGYSAGTATTTSTLYFTGEGGSDDFDTGNSPNSTTWSITGSPAITSGYAECAAGQTIYSTATTGPYSLSFHCRYRYATGSTNQFGQTGWAVSSAANVLITYNGETNYWRCIKATASTTASETSSAATWYYMDFFWVSSTNATFWQNGVSKTTITTNVPIVALSSHLYSRPTYGPTVDADFIMVRKFTNGAEPAHSTWGSEECAVYINLFMNHNSLDGCYLVLSTPSQGMQVVSNGSAYSSLSFNITAACNGSSLYSFINFTYSGMFSNSSDLNPDGLYTGLTSNVTVWAYFELKGGGTSTYSIARFDFDPSNPIVNTEIVFNATQSYNSSSVSFEWNFDDANTTLVSDSFLVVHSYGSAGLYNVSLALHGAATTLNQSFTFYSLNLTVDLYASGWAAGNASGYSDGYLAGWAAGNSTGYSDGWAAGNSTGYSAGYSSGYAVGYAVGYADGLAAGGGNRLAYWIAGGFIVILIAIPCGIWFVRRK